MRTVVALQLGFCSLCLVLVLLQDARAQLPDPPAVNCEWSRWSEWSACDPCTKTRRRSRGVEVFGQFNGLACQGSIGDREFCVPTTPCDQPQAPQCSDSEFTCNSGTCIFKRLECNGDYDCENGEDEDCEPVRKPCGTKILDNSEQGRTAGYGVNILGAGPRMNPFNNDYFNGRCETVRGPSGTLDRRPWNVGVLHYETLVTETASKEIYENSHSLLREILKEMSTKVDVGLSFKFSPSEKSMSNLTAGAEAGVEYEKKSMIKEVSEYTTTQKKSFMRVKGAVQLSTYRMRSREFRVADDFLVHVKSLPLEYEKGIYFAFLEDYGTHYTRNGKTGGEYELVYVLNQDAIKEKKITEKGLQDCIKVGLSADLSYAGVGSGSAHIKPEHCNTLKDSNTDATEGKAVVDKVITSVKGGNLESAVAMRAKLDKDGLMDVATYQAWARTIANFPALLSSEPEPIYMLIPVEIPDANRRIANIKQGIADYAAEYNVCKCKPCQNGGTLALLDGKCICLCPHLFEGLACQNFKGDNAPGSGQRPPVTQEGNWSCWSFWSSCSGNKRTRTRHCNKGEISTAECRGETTNDEYC